MQTHTLSCADLSLFMGSLEKIGCKVYLLDINSIKSELELFEMSIKNLPMGDGVITGTVHNWNSLSDYFWQGLVECTELGINNIAILLTQNLSIFNSNLDFTNRLLSIFSDVDTMLHQSYKLGRNSKIDLDVWLISIPLPESQTFNVK